jgi:hypothetical protein
MPRKRVGETPDGPQAEFLVPRLEVKVMDRPGKVFRSFQLALHKRHGDHHLGGDVRQFASLPGVHLLSHRFEVPLHTVDTDRNTVDERERLRVLGQHRRERAGYNVSRFGSLSIRFPRSRFIARLDLPRSTSE